MKRKVLRHVSRALKAPGQEERAREFRTRASRAHSYDEVLRLCFEYVDVR